MGILPLFLAVNQVYMTGASDEYVVMGNDALMKCEIPSFVADLVTIIGWEDDHGESLSSNPASFGNLEFITHSPSSSLWIPQKAR